MAGSRLGANYARLWTAATVSNLGDGVTLAAMPLLAASLTRSPTQVAVVTFATTLPWLLFALIGGAMADRLDRRRTMSVVDGFRMVVMVVLVAAVLAGEESIALLAIVSFVLGTAETLFDTAAQAIMPGVVAGEQLEVANGRLYAAEIVTNQFMGPPLGALLFGAAAAAPFAVDAASFGLAAGLILLLRGTFRPIRSEAVRPTIRADIAEGLRWLNRHRLLRSLAITLGIMNFLDAATIAIFVLYVLEVLGLPNAGYGLLLTAGALGALLGSVVAARLSRRVGPGRILVGSVLFMGIGLLVPGLWANVWAVGASSALIGLCGVTWNVVTVSLRQTIVPDQLLGRVNSAYRLVGSGTIAAGALLGGVLADAFGLRAPFLIAGTIYIAMVPLLTRLVSTQKIEAANSRRGNRLESRNNSYEALQEAEIALAEIRAAGAEAGAGTKCGAAATRIDAGTKCGAAATRRDRRSGRPVPGGSAGRPLVHDVD